MKTILSVLVGIATLLGGAVGSVVTADDHRYLYIVTGMSIPVGAANYVEMYSTYGEEVTADVQVYDEHGADVGSTTLTIPANNLVRVPFSTIRGPVPNVIGALGDFGFRRTVQIESNGEIHISAYQLYTYYGRNISVYSRILPCSKRHSCDDKDTAD